MGERFLTNTQHVGSILEQLRTRGLIYVDNGKGLKTVNVAPKGLVFAASELDVDERLFKESIDARLRRLITVTQEQGQVVGIAKATPLSLTRIVEWSQSLSTIGIELAPISALAKAEP
ncbi:MAG: hypothetical protein A2516_04320 [Alphaproteobacteria bacterium RIFOXYD12_FULL_60_8]|nr:MAG: hypothetical protein A2516_04320 [Alphaproteobacteria bacterium RIFOXYD12_FULL_60_8]